MAIKIQVVASCSVVVRYRYTLKMETTRFPRMLVSYHITNWHHNPEDCYLKVNLVWVVCLHIVNKGTKHCELCILHTAWLLLSKNLVNYLFIFCFAGNGATQQFQIWHARSVWGVDFILYWKWEAKASSCEIK